MNGPTPMHEHPPARPLVPALFSPSPGWQSDDIVLNVAVECKHLIYYDRSCMIGKPLAKLRELFAYVPP